jgi:hypothetical protein
MDIIYQLHDHEVNSVEFTCRYITDRQKRPSYCNAEGVFEEPYDIFKRRDMFWIECSYNGQDLGPMCVEPSLNKAEDFTISRNHCKAHHPDLFELARQWFMTTDQYQQQVKWNRNLIEMYQEDLKNKDQFPRKIN